MNLYTFSGSWEPNGTQQWKSGIPSWYFQCWFPDWITTGRMGAAIKSITEQDNETLCSSVSGIIRNDKSCSVYQFNPLLYYKCSGFVINEQSLEIWQTTWVTDIPTCGVNKERAFCCLVDDKMIEHFNIKSKDVYCWKCRNSCPVPNG